MVFQTNTLSGFLHLHLQWRSINDVQIVFSKNLQRTTGCCCTVQVAAAGWCQLMSRKLFLVDCLPRHINGIHQQHFISCQCPNLWLAIRWWWFPWQHSCRKRSHIGLEGEQWKTLVTFEDMLGGSKWKCSSCSFLSRNPACFFFILTILKTQEQQTKAWSGSARPKTVS